MSRYISKPEIEEYFRKNPKVIEDLKKHLLDLGIGDVHLPGGASKEKQMTTSDSMHECGGKMDPCDDDEENEVDMIDAQTRKGLDSDQFALPDERKYPIDTAARTRNAAARLEQMKKSGKISDSDYQKARARIARAASKFGIESEYNKRENGCDEESKEMNGNIHVPTAAVITPEMSDRPLHGEVVLLTDTFGGEEGKLVWIQVAKQGKFRGHPAGPFEMTLQTFEEIIRNFRASQNKIIPYDFEHASEQEPTEGSIPSEGAPAQGWIHDLKIGHDGNLYGLTEWLPLARKYIKNKQYKFLSPAIVFGAKDRVTGKPIGARLSSVALTNNPFLDGMAPLAAKHREKSVSNLNASAIEAIRKSLALPEYLGGELNSQGVLSVLTVLPKTEEHAATLRDALRLPLTTSTEDVFETARIACGGMVNNKDGQGASMGDRPQLIEVEKMDFAKQVSDLSTQLAETKVTLTNAEKKAADRETEVVTLSARVKDAEAKIAEVTMSLREETAKRETLETENKELKTKIDEIEVKQFNMRLDEAFETYKDARKLTDEDKEMMNVFLKASPEKFEARFPKIPADKRHLMRSLSDNPTEKKDGSTTTVPTEPGQAKVISMADAALALSRQKGISLDAAQRILLKNSKKSG